MWQVYLKGPQQELELTDNKLSTQLSDSILATSFFEHPANSDTWMIDIIVEHQNTIQAIQALCTNTTIICTAEPLPNKDWLSENRRSFHPIETDHLFIHAADMDILPSNNQYRLCINASTAFGTGRHETTFGCLKALEYLHHQNFICSHFLDVGTGTGILAMAAAHLLNITGLAFDNDCEAVAQAQYNIQQNHMCSAVTVFEADNFNVPIIQTKTPYPLIMANILLTPLVELAAQIGAHIAANGYVILSGILITQENCLVTAYQLYGFSIKERFEYGEWLVIILVKN